MNTHESLDVQEEHPDDTVPRLVELEEVHERVHTGSEGSIQPSTTLADQLDCRLGHIRLSLGGLHVRQRPPVILLRDEFETEDTILGQEHVLREDVHAVDTLFTETRGEGVVSVEVLLERPPEDGTVAVGREGTGQHRHVAEGALQRLVWSSVRDCTALRDGDVPRMFDILYSKFCAAIRGFKSFLPPLI